MKSGISLLVAGSMLAMATVASAANKAETFSISPEVGGITFFQPQHLQTKPLYGLRGGYNFTSALGAELLIDYANTKNTISNGKVDFFRYGGELLYHFMPDSNIVPYVAAGFAAQNFNKPTAFTNSNKMKGVLDYGLGAKFFLTDNIALRGDVRHLMSSYNDRIKNTIEYTAGLYIPFGGPQPVAKPVAKPVEPAPVPAPIPVAAPVSPVDSDGDGVIDSLDKCPNTPPGVVVDKDGCPVDSDKDGVADYLDKCPNTPAGVTVDKDGCPVDSDKDGVPDYLDKCPDTPAGAKVDASGCPIDSDKDGVPDYLDKCPNTPAGVKVDENGCPPQVVERFCNKPSVVVVEFDTNKADIKAKYDDDLNKLGTFLKEFTQAKGEISGHTDNVGSDKYNLKLSQRRADSVKQYLGKKFGIAPERLTTTGYGESKPVASNKTEKGRKQNRRIETNFTCGQ